jgi:hypothetical protein
MPPKLTFHFQRYELKYWLTPKQCDGVKRELARFLELDPYSAAAENHRYPIWSLYCDTPRLACYQERQDGLPYRQKFRFRSYSAHKPFDGSLGDPVFLEIKKRANKIILKDRLLLNTASADGVLEGLEDPALGSRLPEDQKRTLGQFLYFKHRLGLAPKLCVKYDREAYFGATDRNVRVTYDRHICARRCDRLADMFSDSRDWDHLPESRVLLEIKVYNKMPVWLVDTVRRQELHLESISKYCNSAEMLFLQTLTL